MSDDLVTQARGWKAGTSDDSVRMVWLLNQQADAIERLASALMPFALIKADDGDDFSAYDDQVIIRCEITAGDLKRARKALRGGRWK